MPPRRLPPGIEIELIELAGMGIPAEVAAGIPLAEGQKDDFPAIAAKLSDPKVVGVIIGSPVYFNNMSGLCKAFIDRCMALRKSFRPRRQGRGRPGRRWRPERRAGTHHPVHPGGAAEPRSRRRGHEPSDRRMGAALWNQGDDITKDEFGLALRERPRAPRGPGGPAASRRREVTQRRERWHVIPRNGTPQLRRF